MSTSTRPAPTLRTFFPRRPLASFGLLAMLFLSVSCTSIRPRQLAEIEVTREPLFDTVRLDGLVVEDERQVGSSVSVGSTYDHAFTTSYGFAGGSSTTSAFTDSTIVQRNTQYERFDSLEVRDQLRFLLEDARVARRVVDGHAPVRIEGRRLAYGGETGPGKIAWNVVNTLGPGLIGLPYVGTSGATVELRVYVDDQLVGTYRGHGQAVWRSPAWGILPRLGRIRLRAAGVATAAAARRALAELVRDPPQLPDVGLAAGSF